jgi:hypothetical protein
VQFLFLLPFLINVYYASRNRLDKAFLNVYLPCLLFVPTFYNIRLPHMPPISPASGALIPIGLALLLRPKIRWQFRRMDLWVVLFMVSIGLSETLREGNPKDGMIIWIQNFFEMFLAYIVGRQIIEPELRLETIKRMIFLFVCQTPLALYEYRFGVNPWVMFGYSFFRLGNIGWIVQIRGGHARISTCFAHAILAGMLFVVAIALNYYLVQIYKLDKNKLGKWMSLLQKYRVPFFILPVLLFLTGSRMPMACAVLCFMVLQIPRFKKMQTGVIVVALVTVIGGSIIYAAFVQYTSIKEGQTTDEAQTSALYRRQLLENYAPTLEQGGWLGWGVESFPRFPGQESVDNNYLILQLAQGKLGKYSFILLGIEGVWTLALAASRFKSKESLYLIFSLLGGLIGIFVALSTVALFEQVIQVLFLILGWSQSLQDTRVVGAQALSTMPEPKFRFKRVIA